MHHWKLKQDLHDGTNVHMKTLKTGIKMDLADSKHAYSVVSPKYLAEKGHVKVTQETG